MVLEGKRYVKRNKNSYFRKIDSDPFFEGQICKYFVLFYWVVQMKFLGHSPQMNISIWITILNKIIAWNTRGKIGCFCRWKKNGNKKTNICQIIKKKFSLKWYKTRTDLLKHWRLFTTSMTTSMTYDLWPQKTLRNPSYNLRSQWTINTLTE